MSNRDGILMPVFGMKGSGKTHFTMHCIEPVPRLVVFDPKRSYRKGFKGEIIEAGGGAGLARLKDAINTNDGFRVLYEPEALREDQELHEISKLLMWLQRPYLDEEPGARKVMLVVEEAHTASPNPPNPKLNGFARLVTMGRESGIDVITVTQRPQSISMFIRDNADRVACFQVSGEPAVEAAARTIVSTERPDDAIRSLQKWEYVFAENGAWEKCKPL